jgi:hypothetical protein
MAFTMTNRGLYMLLTNPIVAPGTAATSDIRMAVFKGTYPASVATIRTMNFLSDVVTAGMTEAVATNYARQDLTLTITEELAAANTVTISAPAPVLTSVASGETWTGVAYFLNTAGADTVKELIGLDQPTPTTLATNGQNITLPSLLITISGS